MLENQILKRLFSQATSIRQSLRHNPHCLCVKASRPPSSVGFQCISMRFSGSSAQSLGPKSSGQSVLGWYRGKVLSSQHPSKREMDHSYSSLAHHRLEACRKLTYRRSISQLDPFCLSYSVQGKTTTYLRSTCGYPTLSLASRGFTVPQIQ